MEFECAGSVLGPSASCMAGKTVEDFPLLTLNLIMKKVMGFEGKMTTSYRTLYSH